jgi:hypothetical protein
VARNVDYKTSRAIQAFLGYLHDHYSKRIVARDPNLIMAVAAWFVQESGGLSRVIGNNPFNIRYSPLQSGTRKSKGNGSFAVFSSMAKGFEAAAYLLMHGGFGNKKVPIYGYRIVDGKKRPYVTGYKRVDADIYGYRLALNALMKGGNEGANDFLAALAMSSWDSAHYGSHNWTQAYTAKHNHLIRNYLTYGGVLLEAPTTKKRKELPTLARDFNYKVIPNNFLDPWAAKTRYESRHRAKGVAVTSSSR